MASCNITSSSRLRSSFLRLDAEFFKPNFVRAAAEIASVVNTVPLRSLCSKLTQGSNPKFVDEGLPCVNGKNVYYGTMEAGEPNYVSRQEYQRLISFSLEKNDLVITLKHATKVGRVWIVENTLERIFSRNIGLVRLRANSPVEPIIVLLYLWSRWGQLLLDRSATGGTTGQITLPMSELGRIPIPVFSESEQSEIRRPFTASRTAAIKSESAYAEAKQLLNSELGLEKLIYQKPLSYTANASEVSESFRTDAEFYNPVAKKVVEIIESIPHSRLGQSFSVGNGFPWKSSRFLPDNSGEPVVRIRNIRPSHTDPSNLTSIVPGYARAVGVSKAQARDIVIGMDGIKYFYASMVTGPCYVNQRVAHLRAKPGSEISPEFATFIINSPLGQAQLMRDMTVATTVGHITNRNIRRVVIPTVSQEFHDKITELVSQSINGIEDSKRLLEEAKSRVEQLIEEAVKS